jgi:hypothetical protein
MITVRANALRRSVLTRWLLLLLVAVWTSGPVRGDEVAPSAETASSPQLDSDTRVALWPWQWHRQHAVYDSVPGTVSPHPAVARVIVPEDDAIAYGSGTLIDVRDQYGLVVTNWHVVRDSKGTVNVVFPSGFRSQARPLKVDKDWDLAALVVWRPPIEPVRMSATPPKPGDLLTIHGYGQGQYRIATGHCTQFFAPKENFPCEMVELDVEARQGDSGGPIFNDQGEIAGVLFGAGEGTTIGSFAPRVQSFLASLAPDIGQAKDQAMVAVADRPAPDVHLRKIDPIGATTVRSDSGATIQDENWKTASTWPSSPWVSGKTLRLGTPNLQTAQSTAAASVKALGKQSASDPFSWSDISVNRWFNGAKSVLAVVGLIAIALQMVRVIK